LTANIATSSTTPPTAATSSPVLSLLKSIEASK
jgi:hypothetical protein